MKTHKGADKKMIKIRKNCAVLLAILMVFLQIHPVFADNSSRKMRSIESEQGFQTIIPTVMEEQLVNPEDIVPGRVMVKYKTSTEPEVSARMMSTAAPRREKFVSLQIPKNRDVLEEVEKLKKDPNVAYAEPVYLYRGSSEGTAFENTAKSIYANDAYYLNNWQWGLDAINIYDLWDQVPEAKRQQVTIAILDTGVALDHEDLADSIVDGYDFINDDPIADDDHGHGTHVAGVAAGLSGNGLGIAGVAGGSKIMPVKVLGEANVGPMDKVIEGVYYAVDQGADVINLSLGSPYRSMAFEDAIQYAIEKGVVVVAASGNHYSAPVHYPAAYEGVIAVGAIDYSKDYMYKASFSNIGPELDVVAPGVDILSTVPRHYASSIGVDGYDLMSGTSMATPFVAGMAALLKADNPSLSSAEIRQKIIGSTMDLGKTGKDEDYGYGLINGSKNKEIHPPFTFPRLTLHQQWNSYQELRCTLEASDYNGTVSDAVYGTFDLMKVRYKFENGEIKPLHKPEKETVIDMVYGSGYKDITMLDAEDYAYFVPSKYGYLSSNYILPNIFGFSGTLSLPNGKTAPLGGMDIEIFMVDTSQDIVNAVIVTIPEGESMVSYYIGAPILGEYKIGYNVIHSGEKYIPMGYYSSEGTVISVSDAETITSGVQITRNIHLTLRLWDGIFDVEGSSFAHAQTLSIDQGRGEKTGYIDYGGDIDYFKLVVAAPGFYKMNILGDIHTKLTLYDESGVQINRGNDSYGTHYGVADGLEPGIYYIAVKGHFAGDTGAYRLMVERILLEEDDVGDDFVEAYPLAIGIEVAQQLTPGDYDYYQFTVKEAGKYYIETSGNIDILGILYDAGENWITEDDDSGYDGNFLIHRYLEPGTYYICVRGHASDVAGTYSIGILQDMDDYGDSAEQAAFIEIDQRISGIINGSERHRDIDYFKFIVTEGEEGYYGIALSSNKAQYYFQSVLFDEGEDLLNWGEYSEYGTHPMWEYLSPGIYYVLVAAEMMEEDQPYEFIIEKLGKGFEDENLERVIREALEKPEGELFISALDSIDKLEANHRGITNLNGIQYLRNLRELNLEGNDLTEIGPLHQLHQLYYLRLDHNKISDLGPISNLTELTELSLAYNNVTSIRALKNLIQLWYLRLNNNQISSISDLNGLTKLGRLYLSSNRITDYTPVKGYYAQLQDKDFILASSSDGGGSGGSSGAVNRADKPLVQIEKKDGINGQAVKVIVDEEKAKAILNDDLKLLLLIDGRTGQRADKVEIEISGNTVRMADAKGKTIKIETDHGSFEIKPGTLELGNSGEKVVLTTEQLSVEDVPNEIKNMDREADVVSLVFAFTLTIDGKKVTSFNQPIRITVKVDMSKLKDKDKVGIYYYNEEKGHWEYVGGMVNGDGTVTFETDHFSKYVAMEYNKTFSDISDHWAKRDIEVIAARHIAKGVSDDRFAPNAQITRAEFTTLIVNALNIKETTNTNVFQDVPTGAWYQEAVNKAYKAGIVSGTSINKFSPNDTITREQMATMIMKAYAYASGENLDQIVTTMELRFNDQEKASGWARRNIILANAKGFMNGLPGGVFGPKLHATRAQAVVVIKNMLVKTGVISK